jgi:hypothetical protein
MTQNEFIGKVAVECIENDVSLKIIQKEKVGNYGGWFDSNKKELVCAYKSINGFEILIHEYHHFLQWKNNPKFWKKCEADKCPFLNWVEGEETSKNKLTRAFNKAIELERDCEINSINFIKKHNLDVNLKQYILEANAYIYSYHYVKKYRNWPLKTIYTENVIEKMPKKILSFEHYKKGVDEKGNSVISFYEQLSS